MPRLVSNSACKRVSTFFKNTLPSENTTIFAKSNIANNSASPSSSSSSSSIQFVRGYNLALRGKYNINEILINKNLTSGTIRNLRSLNQARSNSTTTSSSTSSSSSKKSTKAPKESLFSKFKRAFTFTISTVAVISASGLAIIVIYLLLAEIAFPSGDTQTFNRAVKLVEKDEISQKLLSFEDGERLKAFGEVPGDKWTRNRPISSVRRPGLDGKEHVLMRFTVESKTKTGVVQLEAIDDSFWKQSFSYIILDVPGENRHYIIKPKAPENSFKVKDKNTGFLGVKWGPKKD